MSDESWIWAELGIAATDDATAIRRAYAVRLKAIDTEADPDAFIALRYVRDAALARAAGLAVEPPPLPRERAAEPPNEPGAPIYRRPVEQEDEAPPPPDEGEPLIYRRPADPEVEAPAVHDLPELPSADLERIQALLFEGAEPVSPDELEMLTRRILAEPAAERIDVARWLEAWMAETIVQAMPRSDAMIPSAVAHFRWRERENELKRPPIIDYILERSVDPAFLIEFKSTARYDLSIAEQRQFAALGNDGGVHSSLRGTGQDADSRDVGGWLAAGIFFFPYIFGWLLLRSGHSAVARIFGLSWLALWLLLMILPAPPPPPGSTLASAAAASPPTPVFVNLGDDVSKTVAWMTRGELSLEIIGLTNPSVHEALADRWWETKNEGGDPVKLWRSVADLLEQDYCPRDTLASAQAICDTVRTRKAELPVSLDAMQSAEAGPMAVELDPMIRSLTSGYLVPEVLKLDKPDLYSRIAARWRLAKSQEEGQPTLEAAIAELLRGEYCAQPNTSEAERICFGMIAAKSNRADAARRLAEGR